LTLAGKTILVTRSKEASTEFRIALESRGASVFCLATIEIKDPDSWEACDNALWKLAEYDSVCFTSKNAVEKFIQRSRLLRPQALNTLGTRNIYAVGEKTKSTLEASGFSVQPVPRKHSAEELAHSFYGDTIKGRRFLFPKSNIARDVLPSELRTLGAAVDEVIVYKTVIPESENLEHIRVLLTESKITVVTFFSPSSVRNFVEMLGMEILENVKIAVIGSTTAEAVKETGLGVAIIAHPSTAEGLMESIEKHFSAQE
jgi:uroporphyrinogen III methyltransferase/synthase